MDQNTDVTYSGFLLRCPACQAGFTSHENNYHLDVLTRAGTLRCRRYLLCDRCSAVIRRNGRRARRVLRRAVRGILQLEARHVA